MSTVRINYNKCMCRNKYNENVQCNNNQKYDSYCGIHIKCYEKYGRIDEPLKCDVDNINKINCHNFKQYKLHKLSYNKLKYLRNKYCLLCSSKKKRVLLEMIMKFLNSFQYYADKKSIQSIIKIQALYRGKFIRDIYGLPNIHRKLCSNPIGIDGSMFWEKLNDNTIKVNTKCKINEIFGFYDNNVAYCFTIQSFEKNMKYYGKNPYTCQIFNPRILRNFNNRIQYIKKNGLEINQPETFMSMSPVKKIKFKTVRIFHILDTLGNYTDHQWFINLSLSRLKLMYFYGKDIWNYQFNDISQKKKILPPSGKGFYLNYSRINLFRNQDKCKLQNILLNEIERFITLGETIDLKKIGAWIILTSLAKASAEVARALPHLL